MLLPPGLHLRQPRLHLRQRLRGLALHDVDAQGLQFAADDIDGWAARFLVGLGAVEVPLARSVEVAGLPESVGPVAGDRGDIRPGLARVFTVGLGGGAGLGGGLLVEGQAGIGAAAIPQRIGKVAEAGPARLALRGGLGGGLQMREQARQQAGIAGAGDEPAGEVTQPVLGPGLDAIDQGAAAGLQGGGHVLVLEGLEHRLQPLGIGEADGVLRQVGPVLRVVVHPGADALADQLVAGEVGIGIVRSGALLRGQAHGHQVAQQRRRIGPGSGCGRQGVEPWRAAPADMALSCS